MAGGVMRIAAGRWLVATTMILGCGAGSHSDPDGGGTCRADNACLVVSAPATGSAQNPCYSPDGTRLLFTQFRGGYNIGPAALFLVDATGGSATAIVDDGNTNVNLPGTSWNPTTNRITFTSDAFGPDEIMTAAPDGSAVARVTTHTGDNYFEPSFAPSGAKIVFEVNRSPTSAEIWTVRVDGSAALAQLTSGNLDRQPNWSPRGDRILFQRLVGSTWRIFTMATDGSDLTAVSPVTDSSTDAAWSPDAARIVYSGSHAGDPGASLYVVAATLGTPVRVTTARGYDGACTWSPDGSWIAFESSSDVNGDAPTGLWRVPAPR
jgi:TolB protein